MRANIDHTTMELRTGTLDRTPSFKIQMHYVDIKSQLAYILAIFITIKTYDFKLYSSLFLMPKLWWFTRGPRTRRAQAADCHPRSTVDPMENTNRKDFAKPHQVDHSPKKLGKPNQLENAQPEKKKAWQRSRSTAESRSTAKVPSRHRRTEVSGLYNHRASRSLSAMNYA